MKKQSDNDADIVGLLVKIQEQLAALDQKVEALINKGGNKPVEERLVPKTAFPQPASVPGLGNARPNDQHKGRPMYQATCADCKKDCEIPFKPTGDRPVYCKECFLRRKSSNKPKTATEYKPPEVPPVPTVINAEITIPEPSSKEKKRPSASRKPSGRKKPVARKKK